MKDGEGFCLIFLVGGGWKRDEGGTYLDGDGFVERRDWIGHFDVAGDVWFSCEFKGYRDCSLRRELSMRIGMRIGREG